MVKLEKTIAQYDLENGGFVVEVVEEKDYDDNKGEFVDLLLFYLFYKGYGEKIFLDFIPKTNNCDIEATINNILAKDNYIKWYRENIME